MPNQLWIDRGRGSEGPYSAQRIRDMASRGELQLAHLVSPDGSKWISASKLQGVEFAEPTVARVEDEESPILSDEISDEGPAEEDSPYALAPLEDLAVVPTTDSGEGEQSELVELTELDEVTELDELSDNAKSLVASELPKLPENAASPTGGRSADSNDKGIWRDGQHLVLDRSRHKLPDVCLFTNQPVGRTRSEVRFTGPGESDKIEACSLKIPVHEDWKGAQKAGKRRVGRLVFLASLGPLLIGVGSAVIGVPQAVATGNVILLFVLPVVILALGLIGCVIGLAWPFLDDVPGPNGQVRAAFIAKRHIWISGAHERVLKACPSWRGEQVSSRLQDQPTAGEKLAGHAAEIIIVVVSTVVIVLVKYFVRAMMDAG